MRTILDIGVCLYHIIILLDFGVDWRWPCLIVEFVNTNSLFMYTIFFFSSSKLEICFYFYFSEKMMLNSLCIVYFFTRCSMIEHVLLRFPLPLS